MNINDCFNIVNFIIRKNRGSWLTVAEFNQNINLAFRDAIEEWFSGYGKSQKLHDALRLLRKYQPFTSDSSGFVLFPSDYMHLLGTPGTVYGSTVTKPIFVNEDEFNFAITSQLRPVDLANPILLDYVTEVSGVAVQGFSIYPQTTNVGFYWYLRQPAYATLVVTQVGRVLTYDPTTSVQLETNEAYYNNIISKALKFSGINMSEQEITAFGQMYNQETNANNP